MTNYFTRFSCLLDVGTPDNAARALDLYNRLSKGPYIGRSAVRRLSPVDRTRTWRHPPLDARGVTGSPRYVICAVGRDDADYVFTPFGHLADGNPYKAYLSPAPEAP